MLSRQNLRYFQLFLPSCSAFKDLQNNLPNILCFLVTIFIFEPVTLIFVRTLYFKCYTNFVLFDIFIYALLSLLQRSLCVEEISAGLSKRQITSNWYEPLSHYVYRTADFMLYLLLHWPQC